MFVHIAVKQYVLSFLIANRFWN